MRADSLWLRRLALWGSRSRPDWWLRGVPALCGVIFGLALGEQRRHVRSNLRRLGVTGERAVYRTFREYAACLAEGLALEGDRIADVKLRVTGAAGLEAALASPTGVVVVTAHVGPWDTASSLIMRDLAAEVTLVMRREANLAAGAFHDALREQGGVKIVHVGDDPLSALALRHALGPGRVVALQLDRSGWREGRVQAPLGPFRLAALTGAPLVPVFAARHGLFDYELRVGAVERPTRATAQAVRASVEQQLWSWLQAHPTQWFDFREPRPA